MYSVLPRHGTLREVGRRPVPSVHRITSKKEDSATLCFYFEDDVTTPVWVRAGTARAWLRFSQRCSVEGVSVV